MTEVGNIVVKWGGKEYTITGLQSTSTVLQFKNLIYAETCVLPERQKLLGLKCSGEWQFMSGLPKHRKSDRKSPQFTAYRAEETHQNLLKLINFWQSYPKNKRRMLLTRPSCLHSTNTTVVYTLQIHYRHTTVVYVMDTTVVPAYCGHDCHVYRSTIDMTTTAARLRHTPTKLLPLTNPNTNPNP